MFVAGSCTFWRGVLSALENSAMIRYHLPVVLAGTVPTIRLYAGRYPDVACLVGWMNAALLIWCEPLR